MHSAPSRGKRLTLSILISLLACGIFLIIAMVLLPGWPALAARKQARVQAARYDEVVRMVETSAITGGSVNGDMVTLPEAYGDLSPARDGRALVYRKDSDLRVLFYVSGDSPVQIYMYSSYAASPEEFQGECGGLEPERPNWYLLHCP